MNEYEIYVDATTAEKLGDLTCGGCWSPSFFPSVPSQSPVIAPPISHPFHFPIFFFSSPLAFRRTLLVAHCGPTPMTCGSCSCREHITNSVIGVSRPSVLDCGTTFHLDSGGRDLPSIPSDNLWKLIYLATEALSDSVEFIGAIEISFIYLSIYLSPLNWRKRSAEAL